MKKRLLASLLSLCLLIGLMPTAMAEENEPENGEPAVCTKSEGCLAETHDEECPLYKAPTEEKSEVDAAVAALQAMIAALPLPKEIDPEDQKQVEEVSAQLDEIYAFAEKNDLDVEEDETVNAVIAALYPIATYDVGDSTVATEEELRAAIEAAKGTAANPTTITVSSNIKLSAPIDIEGKHIVIQGQSGTERIYADTSKTIKITTTTTSGDVTYTYFNGVTDAANPDMIRIGTSSDTSSGTSVILQNIVIDANNVTIGDDGLPVAIGNTDCNLRVIRVGENGSLTMEDGATVEGGALKNWIGFGAGIVVDGGTFTMNGGLVTGIYSSNHGAVKNNNGIFMMKGGIIEKNVSSYNSSAIFTTGISAVTKIDGGVIQNNKTPGDSGTVAAMNGATLYFHSGEIKNNYVNNGGGGIYVSRNKETMINER